MLALFRLMEKAFGFWTGCLKLQTMTQIFLLLSIVMNIMSALKTGEGRVVTLGVGVGVLKAASL